MKHIFPTIYNIKDVLPALEVHPEFTIKTEHESGILVINYLSSGDDTFFSSEPGNPLQDHYAELRRECRGLKFDLETGDIVTRPHPKFFNVNEKPETQEYLIDWTRPHVVLDKLDGSFLTDFINRKTNVREWHTKMGNKDLSSKISHFISKTNLPYEEFCDVMRAENKTPTFEFCSRRNKIVLDYTKEELILTSIRDLHTGEIMSYWDMADLAGQYDIPVVKALEIKVDNIEEFLEQTYALEGVEGYVIRFDDGQQYKVKCHWYCETHDDRSELLTERDVWSMIVQDTLDDRLPFLDAETREQISAFSVQVNSAIQNYARELEKTIELARDTYGNDKKRFALEFMTQDFVLPYQRGIFYALWSGQDANEVVKQYIGKNIATQRNMTMIAEQFNLDWNGRDTPGLAI